MSTASDLIDSILADPDIAPCVAHIETVPPREAIWAPLPDDLDPRLVSALGAKGYGRLYSHQRAAYDAARAGRNVVVVTPTASGKTLCYNLPVVQRLLEEEDARALYLFPTKALSQDQQSELNELSLGGELPVKICTYDGDTPDSLRVAARDTGRIIITNPDMLHSGVLPNHAKWIRFFSGLRYIVVDEMHAYRGVFGSHVAGVIRRLKRIAAFYGASPTFILCSATIGNPAELACALVEEDVEAITENGAPRGERRVVFYNPPLVDSVQGVRMSSATESERIALKLLKGGVKTILFARSRVRVELIASYITEALANLYTDNSRIKVSPYRSGLLPSERRAIERGLREGSIQGVVSTNALELGIDIGGLDAAVVAGFPGSFASFWQQAGRAGRRGSLSVAFLVASSSPLDQFIITHPEYFFGRSPECAHIDPDNPYIFTDHVKCAAFELPFKEGEALGKSVASAEGHASGESSEKGIALRREATEEALGFLSEEGIVRRTGGRWFWSADSYPSASISLRSATADNIVIVDRTGGGSRVIGEMDRPSAKELIFDDAVYIHLGRQFIVRKLDLEKKTCFVEEKAVDFWTDAVVKTDLEVLTEDAFGVLRSADSSRIRAHGINGDAFGVLRSGVLRSADSSGIRAHGDVDGVAGASHISLRWVLGDVLVRSQVEKYKKLKFHSHENIGYGEVHLPPEEMQTRYLALAFPKGSRGGDALAGLDAMSVASVLAGAGRLIHDLAPVYLMCDPHDLGLAERVRDPHFEAPVLFFFDRYPGGTGLAEGLAGLLGRALAGAGERISSCPCVEGCPSCIGVDFLSPEGRSLSMNSKSKDLVAGFLGLLSAGIDAD
jgi:DEAD/DEAH box helicase domain-containing protein